MTVPATAAESVGVDLVDVDDLRRRWAGRDDTLAGVFTPAELAYCRAQRDPWPHLAARLAAKEAVFKALGRGLAGAMSWLDVEVSRDEAGAPALDFHGATAAHVRARGYASGAVSLSHTRGQAVAVVLFRR